MKAKHRIGMATLAAAAFIGPALARDGGDPRRIEFTLPFKKAMAKARAEQRMIFLKPIYGGVDVRRVIDQHGLIRPGPGGIGILPVNRWDRHLACQQVG